MTQPRTRKCAAYRSASASGACALTRNSSAGNFLAFGEIVMLPHAAVRPRCHYLGDATTHPPTVQWLSEVARALLFTLSTEGPVPRITHLGPRALGGHRSTTHGRPFFALATSPARAHASDELAYLTRNLLRSG